MSLTEQQLEQRLNYITGSDSSVICGVNPWGNVIDLWRYKTRLSQAPDISQQTYVKAGNYLEPALRAWFSDETGKDVQLASEMLIHKDIPFLAGNIDGYIKNENALLEIKTTSRGDGWGELGEQKIPLHYLCQISHYMAVGDFNCAYVAVLIGGNDFRIYHYARNEKLEKTIIQKEIEFWECVKNQIPPIPRTGDEVMSLCGLDVLSEKKVATGEIQAAINEANELQNQIDVLDAKKDKALDKIKVFMKNHDTLVGQNGKMAATWRVTKEINRFDMESFKSAHKDLADKFMIKTPGQRRFLLK